MWMISVRAFFERSPSPWMMTPQPTEQYGQVFLVSLVCASLNVRTSASAGANPSAPRLVAPTLDAVSFRNPRREVFMATSPGERDCPLRPSRCKAGPVAVAVAVAGAVAVAAAVAVAVAVWLTSERAASISSPAPRPTGYGPHIDTQLRAGGPMVDSCDHVVPFH